MSRKGIVYPQLMTGGGQAGDKRKAGPLAVVGKVLGAALLLGGMVLSATLAGTVIFLGMAVLFVVGALVGLGMMWRVRKLGRLRGSQSAQYVFQKQFFATRENAPEEVPREGEIIDIEAVRVEVKEPEHERRG